MKLAVMRTKLIWAIVGAMLFACIPATKSPALAAGTDFIQYDFNEDGNLEGWMGIRNGVESYKVEGGALQLKLNGIDPFWYAPRPLGLTTTTEQAVTIRMKSNNGTSVAVYFDTDVYPGLSQAKRLVIPIVADGEYHEYSIKAGGHANWKGTVQNLRLDLEPAESVPAEVSIDYIKIGDYSVFSYEFNNSTNGWSSESGLSELQAGAASVSASVYGTGAMTMVSGPVGQTSETIGEMKIRTRIDGGQAQSIKVGFTTDTSSEFSEDKQLIVPVVSDGAFHEYTIQLWEHPLWEGTIGQLSLTLDSANEGTVWETDFIRFQSVALPNYQWNTDGNAQGWIPIHNLADFKVAGGVMSARVTGGDPHLGNDNVEGVIGERDKTLTVRMSATAGSYVSVFFGTEQAPYYAEARRFDFVITADGNMHEYTVSVGDHPEWKGKITKLRMDLEGGDRTNAIWALDEVGFISSPVAADLNIKRSKPALHAGEEAELSVEIANTGGKAFFEPRAELVLSEGLEVVDASAQADLTDLHPGQKANVTWKVRATSESPSSAEVRLQTAGYAMSRSVALPVLKEASAALPPSKPQNAVASVDPATGDAVLENGQTRVVSPKSAFGYGQYQIFTWDDASQGWQLMATVQPFASSVVRSPDNAIETVSFYPSAAAAHTGDGEASLAFHGATVDSAGRQWTYDFDFSLEDGAKQVKTKQNVQSDSAAELLNMTGPVLTVGEGSFGSAKDEALFPGLEWLVGDEVSSSKLDVTTPDHLRLVPHPYKITVPLMAVRQGGHLISLSWDPHQKWDGVNELPAAKFASPNWAEGQNNHVMGISALSVPTWVKENSELAHTAYSLAAGQSIGLEAGITTAEASSVAEAVSLYIKEVPLPEVPEVHSFEKRVDLGLDAYLRTYWDAATKGWRHVNIPSWGTNQFPSDMANLKLLAMADPTRKAEAEQVLSEALSAMQDKKQLGKPDLHIPQYQAAFHVGYMTEALAGLTEQMTGIMNAQAASGAWLYEEAIRYDPPLGEKGAPLVGQTALNAKQLLKYALMTGSKEAEVAGFKGLAAFEAMGSVPRSSQPWEVPLHTPDILAAGHAVGAYVQAYKITGDESYIEKAAFWAQAGMPFVYTWGVDDRPVMKYGTIPIFGASAYINPWFAVPVQWNGLVYAYELLELARYDSAGPWKQLGDGILASAEIQQASEDDEPWRGGYPDNRKLISNSRSDTVMLNPEEIVKTVFMQRFVEGKGPNPDIETTVIKGCPSSATSESPCKAASVTSLSKVTNTSPADTRHLVSFRLAYPAGETTYVLVARREQPRKVTVNDSNLPPSDTLNDAAAGWSYNADQGYLILKIPHSGNDEVKIHY
ncbi:hypothetical protein [Paenibacillus thermotolerans]|uniref:hypothetical protein n=1 Tax=Paenibacillus thermotolerans TaxID=3027807 RepID=UPI002367A09C|nr:MULTISPECIES: hypothetical protein [unclassified Paenibacillus]